jgi:transcriptional regulator NrdR family protein
MFCPRCQSDNHRVLSSRIRRGGLAIWRRRQCQQTKCLHRWSTLEAPAEFVESVMDYIAAHQDALKSASAISDTGQALLEQYVAMHAQG